MYDRASNLGVRTSFRSGRLHDLRDGDEATSCRATSAVRLRLSRRSFRLRTRQVPCTPIVSASALGSANIQISAFQVVYELRTPNFQFTVPQPYLYNLMAVVRPGYPDMMPPQRCACFQDSAPLNMPWGSNILVIINTFRSYVLS